MCEYIKFLVPTMTLILPCRLMIYNAPTYFRKHNFDLYFFKKRTAQTNRRLMPAEKEHFIAVENMLGKK